MTNRESSCLIQTRRGSRGDFLLVTGAGSKGSSIACQEWWRRNDEAGQPWRRSGETTEAPLRGPTIIEDSFGTPGRVQMVALIELDGVERIGRFVLSDRSGWGWPSPIFVKSSAGLPFTGTPAFIQSDRLPGGAYDVLAPLEEGVAHLMCNSPDPAAPWLVFRALETLGQIDALSLVESRLGTGRFELIVRQGSRLAATFREKNGAHSSWTRAQTLFDNAAGQPALIQGRFGRNGHLELLTLDSTGNLWHAWRNNDDLSQMDWHGPARIVTAPAGTSRVGPDDFVALFQSKPGPAGPGTLEAVCSIAGRHYHLSRDQAPPWKWHGPTRLEADR